MTKYSRRRTDREFVNSPDYQGGERRYFDRCKDINVVKIYSGDCYVTERKDEMLVTILGSCVAACIRDPVTGIGGMNHFLLPEGGSMDDPMQALRYGAFAMERLINKLLHLGGQKQRMEVKLFGGGNVIASSSMIGDKNMRFALDFCRAEGLNIVGSDLGGSNPRRVHYYPGSGRVMLRVLRRKEDMTVVDEEKKYAATVASASAGGVLDLFCQERKQ